jgi:hypothetical protein
MVILSEIKVLLVGRILILNMFEEVPLTLFLVHEEGQLQLVTIVLHKKGDSKQFQDSQDKQQL